MNALARPSFMHLPRHLLSSRLTPRVVASVASAIAVGTLVHSFFYPTFDGGKLRWLLVTTSTLLAAVPIAFGVTAKTRLGAVGRTMFLSMLLGIANTFLPSVFLGEASISQGVGIFVTFGVFFGSICGFLYGIPLAVLAFVTQRHVHAGTADSPDRALRNAGIWTTLMVLWPAVAFVWKLTSGEPQAFGFVHVEDSVTTVFLLLVPALACALGIVAIVHGVVRLVRRKTWIASAWQGRVPGCRVRPWTPDDDERALPRLASSDAAAVVEWFAEDPSSTTAYRAQATGVPMAIIG
jgi:hypothetical protein